jgi:hypothetical protein
MPNKESLKVIKSYTKQRYMIHLSFHVLGKNIAY